MNKGFTLIEVIIYLALFSIIIGGGMIAAYQVIQSTDASYNHVLLQEEANFIMRKINWAITGAKHICYGSGSNLNITKISPIDCFNLNNLLKFQVGTSNSIQFINGTDPTQTLNTSRILVTNLSFQKITTTGKPDSVNTSFTLTTNQGEDRQHKTFLLLNIYVNDKKQSKRIYCYNFSNNNNSPIISHYSKLRF